MLKTAIDIPSKDAIAGFRSCLHAQVVLSACRDQLVGVEKSVRSAWRHARLVEALYHPRRYLRVVYALGDNPKLPANRLWPEGRLVYLHAPLRKPMSRRGTIVTIGGAEVEAHCFPNDRRLRGLRRFALRESTLHVWQQWIDQSGDGFCIDPASLQRLLVRYVPEQKWVIRLRGEGGTPSSGPPTKRRIAVRCTSPIVCATLLERHNALAKRLEGGGNSFRVPSVVGVSEDRTLLVLCQGWFDGLARVAQRPSAVSWQTPSRGQRGHE